MYTREKDEILDIDIDKLLSLPMEEIKGPEIITPDEEDERFKESSEIKKINECAEELRDEEKAQKKNETKIIDKKNKLALQCMCLIENGMLASTDVEDSRSNRYERSFEAATKALLWAIKVYCNRNDISDNTTFASLFFGAYKRIKRLTPFRPSEVDPSREEGQSEVAKDIIRALMNQYGLNIFYINKRKIELHTENFRRWKLYNSTFQKALTSLFAELKARNKINYSEEEIAKKIVYFVDLAFGKNLSFNDIQITHTSSGVQSSYIDNLAMIVLKAYTIIKGNKQDKAEPYQRYYALYYMFIHDMFHVGVYETQLSYDTLRKSIEPDDLKFVKILQENQPLQLLGGTFEQRTLHGKQELSRILSNLKAQQPGTTLKKINKAEKQFEIILRKAATDLGYRLG